MYQNALRLSQTFAICKKIFFEIKIKWWKDKKFFEKKDLRRYSVLRFLSNFVFSFQLFQKSLQKSDCAVVDGHVRNFYPCLKTPGSATHNLIAPTKIKPGNHMKALSTLVQRCKLKRRWDDNWSEPFPSNPQEILTNPHRCQSKILAHFALMA